VINGALLGMFVCTIIVLPAKPYTVHTRASGKKLKRQFYQITKNMMICITFTPIEKQTKRELAS
jgi:hypothetical protein